MTVQLITHTPEPERLVAAAAKLCYSNANMQDVLAISGEDAAKFIAKLPEAHQSPLEHVSFTFAIEGVSRALLAQITRHRIASFSVQSQRYVEMGHFGYVVPQTIAENDEALDEYQHLMCLVRIVYNKLIELGIPAEDARFVLPNACETRMIVTMNARELLHFFSLRCCKRAQWEIRAVADEMLRLCKEVAPTLFAKAGAGCVRGHCPEGKMGCKHGDAR
jgi:thymidylate synthase (FAD)